MKVIPPSQFSVNLHYLYFHSFGLTLYLPVVTAAKIAPKSHEIGYLMQQLERWVFQSCSVIISQYTH